MNEKKQDHPPKKNDRISCFTKYSKTTRSCSIIVVVVVNVNTLCNHFNKGP